MNFKFKLLQVVTIIVSGETGIVVSRAEFDNAKNSYLIRYKSAAGRAVEQYWSEDALTG